MKSKKKRSLTINEGLLIKFNTAMRKIANFYNLTEKTDFNVKTKKNINGIISLELSSLGYIPSIANNTLIENIRREVTFLSEVGYGKLIPFHTFSRTVLHSSATNKPWINKRLFIDMNKSYKTIKTTKGNLNERNKTSQGQIKKNRIAGRTFS